LEIMRILLRATLTAAVIVGLTGCFFDAGSLDERRCLNDQACIDSYGPEYRCLNNDDSDEGGYCIVFQEQCDDPLSGESGDAFCDDGVFCNGDEVCNPDSGGADDSGCVSVSRVLSDDIECTEDHCDEANDVVVHLEHNCECASDGGDRQCDILYGGPCIATAVCNPGTLTCDRELKPEGTDCDDGIACTAGTSCDSLGACGSGTTDDDACDDDVFCNGIESCDPAAEGASADGCVGGTRVEDDPAFGDDNECTQTFCDEDAGAPVHRPTSSCECRDADDCRAANPDDACGVFTCDASTGFTCMREVGMFLPPEAACDDQVACTANDVCQPNGSCAGLPSAAFCSIQRPGAVCAPGDEGADEDGCLGQ
jgi:hypothetical protein